MTRKFTLVCEGTSDRALLPILRWMLFRHHSESDWIGQMADLQALPRPPRSLAEKVATAVELYPAEVMFIHRDADQEPPEKRLEEIASAVATARAEDKGWLVPVIPVRMTEAWLLVSEQAVRTAAGNPKGRVVLDFPAVGSLERLPNPKEMLKSLLLEASELSGRRRKKFNFPAHRAQLPECVGDWEILLRLPSAQAVDARVATLVFG